MLAKMSLSEKKLDIIQWVSQIQDSDVIDELQAYQQHLSQSQNGFVSKDEEIAIQKGLDDLNNGRMHPHSDALAIYGKWLKK